MNVTTSIINIKVFCGRNVPNGICVLQEFYAGHQTVRCAVEDFQVSRVAVGNVNAVHILSIEHGVRLANPIYFVNQLACLQVKHNDSVVAFRSRKQPPALQVNSEMVEVSFYLGRQLESLDKLERNSFLTTQTCTE